MHLGVVLGHLGRLSDLHIIYAVKIFNCLGSILLLTIDFEISLS